ncbi:MAG: hypothetical protein SPK97_02880 [Bacteroidales bacterium]|nr:hypothetical protein [Bacteroidales bacterium]
MKKINFIRLLVLMLVLIMGINNVWGDSYCELTGMTNVRLVTRENDAWNYREFTNQGGNHFTYDAYFPANTSYYCQWNIYGSNWTYSWYIWDGANDNPYTIRSGNDKEVARMCFYRHSEAHATSNSFTTATSASGFTHLSVDYWGSYGKGGWNGSGIRFYYEAVANLSPSLSASTGTSEINGKATSTITASCTGGSGSYNYTYSVSDGVSDVTASTLSATSGSSVTFTAPAVSSETTYRITVTATDANSQLSGLASQTAYKDITVKATGTPTVTLNIDKINVNQIKLTGTITDYANYGSSASDLTVGFVVNNGSPVTTSFTDGNTFTKTITELSANTTYSIKAYATNPLSTGYSSPTSATTLTDGTFTIQVEVPHNATAPRIYAWRDEDGYGGTSDQIGTYTSGCPPMTKIATGVNKDWYSYNVSNQFEKLIIFTEGDVDKTDDIDAGEGCYWYNKNNGTTSSRGGALDQCPPVTTSLYIDINDGDGYKFYSMSGTTTAMVKEISLEANTDYDFKIVYKAEYYGKNSSAEVNRDGKTNNVVSAGTVTPDYGYLTINTDVAGTYTFTFNESTKALTVTYPEAYEVTFGRTPTVAASAPTTSPSISSGDLVNNDGTITFTHADANDYYEWVGWFDNEDGTGNALGDDDTYDATIDGEASEIWAVYKEIDYTVTVNVSEGGTITTPESPATTVTGHHVTKTSIEAEYIDGYHFVNWTVTSGTVRFDDANSASTQIQADENSVIQANFEKDKKIYFDNSYTKWAHVWIYLFDNETYWTNTKENGVHPKDHIPTGFVVTEMTKVAGEDYLYEYVYHNPSHNYSFNHLAFSESDQHTYNVFSEQHAAYRGDWCSTLPVYVATAGYESVQIDKDNPSGSHCYYHSGGYWRAYNPKAGDNVYYYWDKFSGGGYSLINGSEFRASGDGSLVAEVQVRLTSSNSDYEFGVHSAACGVDQHYAEGTKITVDNSDKYFKLYKYESNWNIALRTTSEGIYTFVLSQEYDSLRLSVIYPASVGDYRLTYSYDTPAKTRSSDIMKKSKTDAGSVHTSMYVDPTISTSKLVVERCTAITAGVPIWTAKTTFDNTYLMSNFQQNSVATKGVYEMDVTIAGTEGNASTLSNIAVYNGPFYIKTDCAKGGWSDYTKNALDLNTINFDKNKSSTFDYYFCKWIDYARKVYGT